MEKYNEQLSQIINPQTNKTLLEENRWLSLEEKGDGITLIYNRDGIDNESKRKIEDQVVEQFSSTFNEEAILVMTKSSENKKTQAAPPKQEVKSQPQAANLKAGHGVNMNKKPIAGVEKVIAVSSCKGGVGKSTLTVNLALSMAKKGLRVGIIDADIYGPSLPILLGKKGAKPQATEDKRIKPLEAFGVKFISFGLFIGEQDPVIWRGPMLGGVLNQFFFDTDWGELDYLFIDLPPGTGDTQLSLVQNTVLNGVVVVSTPQEVALADTKKGIKMFQQVNIPIVGLVENMSYFCPPDDLSKKYFIFGEGGVQDVAKQLELPFLGEIPLEINLRESADKGEPYVSNQAYENNPVYKSYKKLADEVFDLVPVKKKPEPTKQGFFGRIFS